MGGLDVERAVSDTKDFFELAKRAYKMAQEGEINNRIAASPFIHALIRANDALCLEFLKETPPKYRDAVEYFKKLYIDNYIEERYSRYVGNMKEVLKYKTAVEYRGSEISFMDLTKIKKQVKRFIKSASFEILDEEL